MGTEVNERAPASFFILYCTKSWISGSSGLSMRSYVAYGYVGGNAVVIPLQCLDYMSTCVPEVLKIDKDIRVDRNPRSSTQSTFPII